MPFPIIAAAAGAGALYSLIKKEKAARELDKLHEQPVAKFSETPAMAASRFRAERLAQGGYSPAEKAAFRKNVAEDINTSGQRALDMGGGNLARVIGGMGKINTMGAESKFAASDAALHRQNIQYADKFSQQLQNIADNNIQQQLKQRLMAEQALGSAVQQQDTNMMNYAMLGATQLGGGVGGGAGGAGGSASAGATGGSTGGFNMQNQLARLGGDTVLDTENIISSNLDPNSTDPYNFYGKLGRFMSRPLKY